MSLKRLSSASGNILEASKTTAPAARSESGRALDKRAIITHAGSFLSSDGEIAFDAARIKAMVAHNNAHLEQLKKEYGGEIPVGAYPPLYMDHTDEAGATIGRLMGPYTYEERDIPKVGKNVPTMICERLRFLGADAIEAVEDGRIYHLSPGVDESQQDLILETSAVSEPAAPGAMLLSKGKPKNAKQDSPTTLASGTKKLSKEKHMASKESLSNIKRLSGELKGIKTTLVAKSSDVKHLARKGKVEGELRGLVRMGKMTPAEYRQAKLDDMARLDDKAFGFVLDAYKTRSSVVEAGQRGTTDGLEAGKMAGEIGMKRLRAETKKELKRLGAKVRMEAGEEEAAKDKKMAAEEGEEKKMSDGFADDESKEMAGAYMEHMKHLESALESGDLDKAKEHMSHMKKMAEAGQAPAIKHMAAGDVMGSSSSEMQTAKMAELDEQVGKLTTVVERIAVEVEKILQAEQSEGHEELQQLDGAAPGKEEKELAAKEEAPGEEKKDLAADPEADKEKKDLAAKESEEEKKLEAEARKDMSLEAGKEDEEKK